MKFRYDINALRALAVSAVVLYHYKVSCFPGGFVGVDVFFVISGYLMTNIIVGRLDAGKFSIWQFYHERAKRIVPGLLAMCLTLLAAGYFVLEPATYQYLASTSIPALLFYSNFRFWEATGYFDAQSDVKWLLHTWSLSVEWQFYLAYPIILMGLHKFDQTRRRILLILWALALLSFAACVWLSLARPPTAFYLLPPRAWELIAGGIVALQFANDERRYSATLLASGLLFIGISAVCYDKYLAWPSYWGTLPVIGTCLVIAANRADAWIFRSHLVQKIGRWSYSIYLWHWPVAVAAVYFGFTTANPNKIAAEIILVAAILEAGWLLLSQARRFIEAAQVENRRAGLIFGASALCLTLALGGTITINQGLANRRTDGERQLRAYETALKDWDYPEACNGTDRAGKLRPCRLGKGDDRGILFIGDSFAMQIYGRFAEIAKNDPGTSFTFLASSSCPPMIGVRLVHDRFRCNGFAEKALQFAKARHFARIILVANWDAYFRPEFGIMCFEAAGGCQMAQDAQSFYALVDGAFSGMRTRLVELKGGGAEIVVIGTTPSGGRNVPVELAKRKFLGMDTADIEYIEADWNEFFAYPLKSRLKALAVSVGGRFVDPFAFLCANQHCPTVDREGNSYFMDDCHYRSGAVRTSQFQFLDDAAGLRERVSAAPMIGKNVQRF